MKVREDHRVHGLAADFFQCLSKSRACRCVSAVYEYQSFIGFKHDHIHDRETQQPGTGRHGFNSELGASVGDGRLVGAAVHAVGNGVRQLGAKAPAFFDGLGHLWVGLEDLCTCRSYRWIIDAKVTPLVLIVGIGGACV